MGVGCVGWCCVNGLALAGVGAWKVFGGWVGMMSFGDLSPGLVSTLCVVLISRLK